MFLQKRSGITSLVLGLFVLGLISCSKKDVVSDDAAMSPSDGMAGMGGEGVSAGDAGYAFSEMDTVYYGYDSFTLSSEARAALQKNADWMKANPSGRIQIEGHCDERGTVEYNMALGDRRANAAKAYLVKLGVAGNRIETLSYGKERPADLGHNEAAWARNRRAVFVLLSR